MSSLEVLFESLMSGDEARADQAASQLAQWGGSALPDLYALLKSPDNDHRWWAIRTLAQISETDADCFIESLSDDSVEIRQAAALALASHPEEKAVPALIHALSDVDTMVPTLAANALLSIGKPAVPALLEVFPQSPAFVKIHIMRALTEIRDWRAIPVMMKAMDEDSAILHHWCEIGLEQLGLDMVYLKLS